MPKNRVIIILGVLIALLPVLGFPKAWESFFQIIAGLSIILLSVWSTIDKKLMLKHKAQLRQTRRSVPDAPATPEVPSHFGKRVTDFYPKTAPPGRRVSDLNPTITPEEESTS